MRGEIATIAHRWVKDAESVKSFLHDCIITLDLGMGFHCDTHFDDYYNGKIPCFTRKEAKALDKKMDDCFEVCRRLDLDIYEIGLEIMQPVIDKAIPLPSSKLTYGPGTSGGVSDGRIIISTREDRHNKTVATPLPMGQGTYGNIRITSDDEKTIDMYRLVLDKKAGRLECIAPIHDNFDKIREFLRQRYVRVLNTLELALCGELKVLFPREFAEVELVHQSDMESDTVIKGNEL